MCELFGMTSNWPVEAVASLTLFAKRGGETGDNPDGWGLAYRDDGVLRLHKAPEPAGRSPLFAHLSRTVRSNLVLAHVRKANPPTERTPENTHPFVRHCCGRQWVFAHNGSVPEVLQPTGCCHPRSSTPLGDTDSEHAFCYLLDEIAKAFDDASAAQSTFWFHAVAARSPRIAAYGRFNFLMSDGVHLIAYAHDRLHVLERTHGELKTVLITTEPLMQTEAWRPFEAGELRIYRDAELLSQLKTHPARVAAPIDGRVPNTVLGTAP